MTRGVVLLLVLGLILNIVLIDRAGFIIASTVLFAMTARAFGSFEFARMLSFWRWVRVSVDWSDLPVPQATASDRKPMSKEVFIY